MTEYKRNPSVQESGIGDLSENPFAVHSPDALDTVPADRIVGLFVEEFTDVDTVKQRKHTFIWGSRGSGKTFTLRYLEPDCQFLTYESPEEFLNLDDAFVAIYTPCKKGEIDKSEFDLMDELQTNTLSEHLLNMKVTEQIIFTISKQFPEGYVDKSQATEFAQDIVKFFDAGSISDSKSDADEYSDIDEEPFEWIRELIKSEKRRIAEYLRTYTIEGDDARYTGATSGYHDYLLPMIKSTRKMLELNTAPIYILVDDAFHLNESQQQIINTWIANRDQGVLCIKVSSSRHRYETFKTTSGGRIEHPHDFTEVNIEERYTQNTDRYSKKVERIANKRLETSDVPAEDIRNFLPKSETEEKLFEEIKERTKEEWEEVGKPGRQSDYVQRYAKARLFQELANRKNEKSYAGFENIVHISSGVVRNFLDPCYLMFNKQKSKGGIGPQDIEQIPPSVQNEVLRDYSEQFLQQEPKRQKKDLETGKESLLEKLTLMVRTLGEVFYERLHDENSREPRLFSFTTKDKVPENSELNEVLELGTRMQYFHLGTYSSKEGGGREDWYILNRRFAPMFKLDPTGFEGRIRLSSQDLELAYKDPSTFKENVIDMAEDQSSLQDYSTGE